MKQQYEATDGYSIHEIEAGTIEEAAKKAKEWAADGDYGDASLPIFFDVRIYRVDSDGKEIEDGETDSVEVCIPQPEPDCDEDGPEHDWQSPHAIVGGMPENPGLFLTGSGTKIVMACLKCGCRFTSQTGYQRPDNGATVAESVMTYDPEFYHYEIQEYLNPLIKAALEKIESEETELNEAGDIRTIISVTPPVRVYEEAWREVCDEELCSIPESADAISTLIHRNDFIN